MTISSLEGTQGRGVILVETLEAAVGAIEAMKKLNLNIILSEVNIFSVFVLNFFFK